MSFEEFLVKRLGLTITHGIDPEVAKRLHGAMDRRRHQNS
jgi:hypothetical protein